MANNATTEITDAELAAANSPGSADASAATDTGAEAVPTQAEPSWRDRAAKEYGLDLSSYKDDGDALKYLAEQNRRAQEAETARHEAEQYRELAQYGREYLNVAPEFRQWYNERQSQQKAPDDPFAPPEYDPSWLTKVKRDDLGGYIPDIASGGTPEIVSKLLRHFEYRNNFMANPRQHLESWVDTRAREVAQAILQEQLPQVQRQFSATQFITNNRDWLYEKNENGAFTGELSDEGKTFQGFLNHAATPRHRGGMGLDPEQQEQFALHSLGLWRQARAASGKGGSDPKDDFLKKAAGHGAQAGGSASAALRDAGADGQNQNLTLEQMLRADFKANGIDDSAFASV